MEALIEAAVEARQKAHAPFSGFQVGAALEDAAGRIHTGCNVENATYGLTICSSSSSNTKVLFGGIGPPGVPASP